MFELNRTDMRKLAVRFTYDYIESIRPEQERYVHERLEDLGVNPQDANAVVTMLSLIELKIDVNPKGKLKYG